MAISFKHTFQSAIADDAAAQAAGEVLPSHWNAEHTITCATAKVLGRATAGTGAVEEIDCTAAGRALLDDADAAAQRTTLGLGALATLAVADVLTDAIADGVTTKAPSQNAVFDALALKADASAVPNPILFACNAAAVSLGNDTSAHSVFPAANDTLTLDGDSTYYFEASIHITNGTTAHTDAFGFGGTATFTSLRYVAEGNKHASGTLNAFNQLIVTSAASTVLTAGATTAGVAMRLKGIMRVNAGGTVIPQWTFNNAPGGTNQVEPNSYIRFQKIGAGAVESYGSWA